MSIIDNIFNAVKSAFTSEPLEAASIQSLEDDCLAIFDGMSLAEINAVIEYRGVDFKMDRQLDEAQNMYAKKIPKIARAKLVAESKVPTQSVVDKTNIRKAVIIVEKTGIKAAFMAMERNSEEWKAEVAKYNEVLAELDECNEILDAEERYNALVAKEVRLKEKYACVLKEKELRDLGLVERDMHRTVYYIDLDGGNDGADGLSTGNAWLTIEKYTTTTVRSAGDIAYVRAATDEVIAADIIFDEDGDIGNRIKIIGCDSTTNDPWGDADDTKPILDFNGADAHMRLLDDYLWYLERLDFKDGGAAEGGILFEDSRGWYLKSCDFHDFTGTDGARLRDAYHIVFDSCTFTNNATRGLLVWLGTAKIINTSFDSGAQTTDHGINCTGGIIYISDSTFGSSSTHDVASIVTTTSDETFANITCRNCLFSDATEVNSLNDSDELWNFVRIEDHDQTAGAITSYYMPGTVTRDSVVQLDSLDSAKLTPNSNICSDYPLSASGVPDINLDGDYQIYCAAAETTVTIKARETAAWTSDPSASEFRLCASYLDGVSGQSRTTVYSTQSLSGTTEVSFSVTFTPNAAGWVYVWFELALYEAGKSVNVSAKRPAVT